MNVCCVICGTRNDIDDSVLQEYVISLDELSPTFRRNVMSQKKRNAFTFNDQGVSDTPLVFCDLMAPEDGGTTFFRNVGNHSYDDKSSEIMQCQPQISYANNTTNGKYAVFTVTTWEELFDSSRYRLGTPG